MIFYLINVFHCGQKFVGSIIITKTYDISLEEAICNFGKKRDQFEIVKVRKQSIVKDYDGQS